MSRTIKITAVVLFFVLLNIVAGFFPGRLDFTEGQIYTLSPSTVKILGAIQDPVEIKVFLSDQLPPQVMSVRQLITDKLNEYKAASNGKIILTFVDPAKDDNAAKLVQALNIPVLNLQVIDQDQMQVMKTYMGLAVLKPKKDFKGDSSSDPLAKYDKEETLPVIQNVQSLEYDLTTLLLKVSTDKQQTVGFLTGHGEHEFAPPQQLAQMQAFNSNQRADYDADQQLEKSYAVTPVNLTETTPSNNSNSSSTQQTADPLKDITTLVVAGPTQEIPNNQKQKIYDFIAKGGNAIFLLDSMQMGLPLSMTADPLNTNNDLLAPWGLQVEPELVADSNDSTANFTQGMITYILPYPLFINASNLDKQNPITENLTSFVLPWTSPITITKTDNVKVDTLATSSNIYNLLSATPAPSAPTSGTQQSGGTQQTAAPTKTTPINVQPQQDFGITNQTKDPVPVAVMAQKSGEGKIVVIGDSNFIANRFSNRSDANMALFYNAVDALTLGDDLIQIRSKTITDRPIAKLDQFEKDLIQWGLTFGLPLIFIAYGFIRRALRNAKKKQMSRI
jgi:gliding-associated putative ABC transporter substrate-binding component GldG